MWLLILAVYVPILARGRVMVDNPALIDVSFNVMPNVYWMGESWRRGEFPLWNPHTACGAPHLGYSQSGGLYPVAVLLFSLAPYIWAYSLEIIFHSLVAAALFYLLLRRYGGDPVVSGAASMVFFLSGSFLGRLDLPWMHWSICGLMALWVCLKELSGRARLSWFIGACLSVAWCGIAGDVELLAYGLMVFGFLMFLESGPGAGRMGRLALWFLTPAAVGFLMVSPVALSTMEMVYFSIRGPQMPFKLNIISMGLPWSLLLPTILFPFKYYRDLNPTLALNSGLSFYYQGFLIVGLIIWGMVLSWREKALRPPALAWAGLSLFVLVREGELGSRIIDMIPLLGILHYSEKALLLIHALGLILAVQVLSGVISGRSGGKGLRVLGLVLLLSGAAMIAAQPWCLGGVERYAIGAAAVCGGLAFLARQGGGPVVSARAAVYFAAALTVVEVMALALRFVPRTDPRRFELSPPVAALARTLPPESRYAVFEQLLTEDPASAPPIFGTIEIASGANNIVGPSRVPPARIFLFLTQIYRRLIYSTVSGEKMFSGWSMTNPGTIDRGRMHLFNLAGPSVIFNRGLSIPYASPYSLMRPGAVEWEFLGAGLDRGLEGGAMIKGPTRMTAGFAGFAGDRVMVKGTTRGEGAGWLTLTAGDGGEQGGRLLLARCFQGGHAARLVAGMDALAQGGVFGLSWTPAGDQGSDLEVASLDIVNPARPFQEEARFDDLSVYRNEAALPRAFIARSPVVITGTEAILKYMDDPARFSPLHDVVLEEESAQVRIVEHGRERRPAGPEGVEIRSYGPERVEMTARLSAPGFVVFTDTYFAGWRAEDVSAGSRREVRIYPADCAFRAVFLPEGVHRLSWIYRPVPFRIGLWCGACSLLLAVLCYVLAPLLKTRRTSAGP